MGAFERFGGCSHVVFLPLAALVASRRARRGCGTPSFAVPGSPVRAAIAGAAFAHDSCQIAICAAAGGCCVTCCLRFRLDVVRAIAWLIL